MGRGRYPNIRKVTIDGYTFASGAEAARYQSLKLQVSAKLIDLLEVHPHFDFVVNGYTVGRGYTADFAYTEIKQGLSVKVVEEVKGPAERDWPLRRDLFLALYPDVEFRVNGELVRRHRADEGPCTSLAPAPQEPADD